MNVLSRIKVCGIREAAFAVEAAQRGVGYLGFIFAAASPRRVSVAEARAIRDRVYAACGRPRPRFVGVFVEQTAEEILSIAAAAGLDVVQQHSPRYTDADVSALKAAGYEVWRLDGPADATLIDGRDGSRTGGTGRLADWSRIAALKEATGRVVLAGGISAGNIREALATGADVIDVNSSLETAPGVKSAERLRALLDAARA